MRTRTSFCLIVFCAAFALVMTLHSVASSALAASPAPTATPVPTAAPALSLSEEQFVDSVTTDLQNRFGSTAAAIAAGYYRYTDEDATGAISWVNTKYWKSDQQHPSQLWYDVHGRLIGVDFSVPKESGSTSKPQLFGVSQSRWIDFIAHVHYGVKSGLNVQFGAAGPKTMARVRGNFSNPTAADVVKLGKAKSVKDVAFTFFFPAIWDLQVWLVPNPLGAFAESNPNVKPSNSAKTQM